MHVYSEIKKSNAIGIYLFASLIPFNPKWLGFCILIIILEQLFRGNFAKPTSYKKIFDWKTSGFWLLLFYLLHFVGMLYTENTSFGWMDIGMKASFGIFPIIFVLFNFKIDFITLFKSFITGAIIGVLVCFYLSYLDYSETGKIWHFQESYLSHFMHRSYWATYLSIAFSMSLYLIIKKKLNFFFGGFLSLILFAVIFISGSKAGIIIIIFTTIAFLVYIAKETKQIKWVLGIATLTIIIAISALSYFPSVTNRIESSYKYITGEYEIDVTKSESTGSRILMWRTAIQLIQEKPIFGFGTGDVKDALIQQNIVNGYIGVAELKMNAHNQFLNTGVALGIIGFIVLLNMFLWPFVFSKTKNYRFIHRIIIFTLVASLFTEAFLETQAGIIPVAFLLCVFSLPDSTKN